MEAHLDTGRDGMFMRRDQNSIYIFLYQSLIGFLFNLPKLVLGLLIPLVTEWKNKIEFVIKPFEESASCPLLQAKYFEDDYRFLKNQ